MDNGVRQRLYLIVDEMRGMATLGREFAGNVYERERAHRINELAAELAGIAEENAAADLHDVFFAEPWPRVSPVIGVEAAVLNAAGALLLVQRRDNAHWALPGGVAEIGQTLPEAALRELWEEAGVRGAVTRLLGVFDGRLWGSQSRVHLVHLVFLVRCADPVPVPGMEMLAAAFFTSDALPTPLHRGHEMRIPQVFALAQGGETAFDPASSDDIPMPMEQRPPIT